MCKESVSHTGQKLLSRRLRKADNRREKGIRIGRAEDSNEHIVCTPSGALLTRKRLPKDFSADEELFIAITGTPWEPRPKSKRGKKVRFAEPIAIPMGEVAPQPWTEGPVVPAAATPPAVETKDQAAGESAPTAPMLSPRAERPERQRSPRLKRITPLRPLDQESLGGDSHLARRL